MRLLLACLLCLIFVPTYTGIAALDLYQPGAAATVHIRRVALDSAHPERRRLGALTYLDGYVLSSWDEAFGGFSSMVVRGDRFLMLSDGGNYLSFRLLPGPALADAKVGALPNGPGSGRDKVDRDSESTTRDPATGQLWVGFETANQIWRYSADFASAERHAAPPAMAHWKDNLGAESLVRLTNGHFLVLQESNADASPIREGLMFDRDPTLDDRHGFRFRYQPPGGFDPSDAVELADGNLIVLNRRFGVPAGFEVAVAWIDRATIRPGALVIGHEIARFTAPVVHDNFEAVATARENGKTILWIASDDNQQWWEASYLLKFRLDLPAKAVAKP